MMINALVLERQIPDIPVFVDSPLPAHVTEIFREHTACYDSEAAQFLAAHDNPFGFRRLPYIRDVEESKALNSLRRPCIMISASGMAEAGTLHNINVQHVIGKYPGCTDVINVADGNAYQVGQRVL